MFKSFIFDMDGVIINSEPLHFKVDQYVMKKFGIIVTEKDLEEYVGMTDPEMWSKIKLKYSLSKSVKEIINMQLHTKLAILSEYNEKPIEGIRELLNLLKSHDMKIGLASSSHRKFIEAVLNKFNIHHYFQCVISGEEVDMGKPAPDIYLRIAKLLETEINDCIVLEDSRNGVAAAKAAGMKCIGYQNFNSGNQDLTKANVVINSVKEIDKKLLESL